MTRDLDTLLRNADPLRHRPAADDAVLPAARARVDRERAGVVPARRRSWGRRVVLIAAAAVVLTAVPLTISVLHGDDAGRPRVLAAAIAANGQITCTGAGYTSAVRPEDSPVRMLPDRLPTGWSYTQIFVRSDDTTGECIPPSLTALREDADGLVTGRISVTGPVDASLDQRTVVARSVPDTVLGHAARRIDLRQADVVYHRWFFTDERGKRWSVEATGMPLDEARTELAAVSISGSAVTWNDAAAPGWVLVHLRQGAPYGIAGQLNWHVEFSDGTGRRFIDVYHYRGVAVPLLAETEVGERVTSVGGHPVVLSQVRVNNAPPGTVTDTPRGSRTQPVAVEISPGTVAYSFSSVEDLPQVEQMLASLRQVPPSDPRLEKYGTD